MMPSVVPLVETQYLPNVAGALYTNPAAQIGQIAEVTSFVICNTDSAAHTVTLYNVASGDSPGGSNTIFAAASIPANTTWIGKYDQGCVIIGPGGSLQGLADAASKVTITVGGKVYL